MPVTPEMYVLQTSDFTHVHLSIMDIVNNNLDNKMNILYVASIFVHSFATFMLIIPEIFVLKIFQFYTHLHLCTLDTHINNLDIILSITYFSGHISLEANIRAGKVERRV